MEPCRSGDERLQLRYLRVLIPEQSLPLPCLFQVLLFFQFSC